MRKSYRNRHVPAQSPQLSFFWDIQIYFTTAHYVSLCNSSPSVCCSLPHHWASQRTSSLWRRSKILVTFLLSTSCSNTSLLSCTLLCRSSYSCSTDSYILHSPPLILASYSFFPFSSLVPCLLYLSNKDNPIFWKICHNTSTALFPLSPNPTVPLMGATSDSSATFPSSSLRTSLHP